MLSGAVDGTRAPATATFLEESSEALGTVVFLVAVLVGVAPPLVPLANWALRRAATRTRWMSPSGSPAGAL